MADLTAEEHLTLAWRNLKGDVEGFSHYIYGICSDYVGAEHEVYSVKIIEAGVRAAIRACEAAQRERDAQLVKDELEAINSSTMALLAQNLSAAIRQG